MRAKLTEEILGSADGKEAEAILRACVHCGFCNATCPSYQVLGDERDGPRGRIYLMKNLLEGLPGDALTQTHLDRCLGCRACETTCPSGVRYSRLLDFVRPRLEQSVRRPASVQFVRWLLRKIVPSRIRFGALLLVGRCLRPVLPKSIARLIPERHERLPVHPPVRATRNFALLAGCVQQVAAPQINDAAQVVLGALEIGIVTPAKVTGCCGALALHLGANEEAKACARRNVDAWYPLLKSQQIEGVLSASSGCTQILKDYGYLLRDEPNYAERARVIASATRDPSQVIEHESLRAYYAKRSGVSLRIAFQSPCSLQHGLRINGAIESLLEAVGCTLAPSLEGHLCCGSAGTYSILQPAIAESLLARKLHNLALAKPAMIATANIGCQLHLAKDATVPVRHWLEILADRIARVN